MARESKFAGHKEEVIALAKAMSREAKAQGMTFLMRDFGAIIQAKWGIRYKNTDSLKCSLHRLGKEHGIEFGYSPGKLKKKK